MSRSEDKWNSVSISLLENPHDLRSWQTLIHSAESHEGLINRTSNQAEVQILRDSYDAFLKRYPTFLRYWTAYALWERRLNFNERAESIFLKALQFGEHDITLWMSYLKFKIETLTNDIDGVLELFENARMKIGYQFHSFEFYELYLEFLETYADMTNKFKEKSIMLLRIMLEIPFYNYSASFERLSKFISSSKLTMEELTLFMHDSDLKALKRSSQNNKKLMQQDLEKKLKQVYTVVQAKTYDLFNYERLIIDNALAKGTVLITCEEFEVWSNYLNFVEQSYPVDYTIQLYERCIIRTGFNFKFVVKYSGFLTKNDMFGKARNMLRKTISVSDRRTSVHLLLHLTDLEIETGNIMMARDCIAMYISNNKDVPISIFEKLLQIEALLNPQDDTYICSLVHEMILATKSPVFFERICRFSISKSSLVKFFLGYVKPPLKKESEELAQALDLQSMIFFWRTLKELANESDLIDVNFPSGFE